MYFTSRFSILNNDLGNIYLREVKNNVSSITIHLGRRGDHPLLWYLTMGIWNQNISTGAIGTVRCSGYAVSQYADILVNGKYAGANLVASATVNADLDAKFKKGEGLDTTAVQKELDIIDAEIKEKYSYLFETEEK